jgi:hypothetical protein
MAQPDRTQHIDLQTELGDNFCSKCQAVISTHDEWKEKKLQIRHHETLREFNSAVDAECPLCFRVLAAIKTSRKKRELIEALTNEIKLDEPLPITVDIHAVTGSSWPGLNFKLGRYNPYKNSFGFRIRLFRLDKIDSSHLNWRSAGETTESVDVSHWLKECLSSHTTCRNKGSDYLPPRLIDCGGKRLRLVLSSNNISPGLEYATLSHCWGKTPTHSILTTSNINNMRERLPESDLPRTFRDAIAITRKLGIRYLWIDSLCIIQRGALQLADWQQHVREMAHIYSNCIVNISASHGPDSETGCFVPKTPLSRPCTFRTSTGEHYSFEYVSPRWLQESHIFSRAWVFQERLLSPRVVYFDAHDVYWECKALRASGAYPEGATTLKVESSMFDTTLPPFDWKVIQTMKTHYLGNPDAIWNQLVEDYVRTNLTCQGDRLPALTGIAQRFNEDYKRGKYVAGIFELALPKALMWKPNAPATRQREYLAPSWSWASIAPGTIGSVEVAGSISTSVISIHMDLIDPNNQYGQVRGGHLVLRGPILDVPPNLDSDEPETSIAVATNPGIPASQSYQRIVILNWDCQPPKASGSWSLLAMSTGTYSIGRTGKSGLILREASSSESRALGSDGNRGLRCFVRMGLFTTSYRYPEENAIRYRVIRHLWDDETVLLV